MPRVALHFWHGRIAPVFDIGGEVLMSDGEHKNEVRHLVHPLPVPRAAELADLGVEVLVCGAISRAMHEALAARGIRVIGFVAGDLEQVMAAWRQGKLDTTFAMPGCQGLGLGRGGKGHGHMQRGRTSCHEEMEQDHRGLGPRQGAALGCARTRSGTAGRRGNLVGAGDADGDSVDG